MTITGILVSGEKSCCKQVPASGMQRDLSPPPLKKKEKEKVNVRTTTCKCKHILTKKKRQIGNHPQNLFYSDHVVLRNHGGCAIIVHHVVQNIQTMCL